MSKPEWWIEDGPATKPSTVCTQTDSWTDSDNRLHSEQVRSPYPLEAWHVAHFGTQRYGVFHAHTLLSARHAAAKRWRVMFFDVRQVPAGWRRWADRTEMTHWESMYGKT